jgi:hypothetical protein
MENFIDFLILEGITRKKVIRKGKRIVKKISTKGGYKVINGKEVRIDNKERIMMKLRNKKSARKSKGKRAQSNRKRSISMNKRKGF